MKTIITQKEMGLKFKNGKFITVLAPGKYRTFGDSEIEVVSVEQAISTSSCTLNGLLKNEAFASLTQVVEVADGELALHYTDGIFQGVLRAGKYAFWKSAGEHKFTFVDLSNPEVGDNIPDYVFSKLSVAYFTKVEVAEYQKARLYFNQKFVKLLDAGTYYFWKTDTKVSVTYVDTRLIQLNVIGQEILTLDKVTLRVNFVCTYKIEDYMKIVTEIDNFEEQLHVLAQLALRDYVGKYRLDELLENKQGISEAVLGKLKEKEKSLYLTVYSADVKDIILPGEIRDIMNTVLIAEKKAQANVITRREEVASTRSLLNTAKLMEENPTLYQLKELEYVEKICEKVGSIHLNGSGDLLTQLTQILRAHRA